MSTASFTDFTEPGLTLPFGKYRGVPLNEIETSYLEWVKTADRITPELLTAIEAELACRTPKTPDRWRAPQGTSQTTLLYARMIVEAGAAELRAALGMDHQVGAAEELLKFAVAQAELDSDPGTLPF